MLLFYVFGNLIEDRVIKDDFKVKELLLRNICKF